MKSSEEEVEQYRKKYAKLSDAELHSKMQGHKEFDEHHIAAKLILTERNEKRDKVRFHLVFWPSLIAATATVAAFILK